MKSEATIGKMVTKAMVTKLDENANVPADKFEIPSDIQIVDADVAPTVPN